MTRMSLWPKTLNAVLIWGAILTALLIGLTTPVTSSKWPFFPALALGVGASIARIFWRWQDGPYRDELRKRMADKYSIGLAIFLVFGGCVIGAAGIGASIWTYQQAGEHPCLCLGDQRGRDWINLMAGGGGGAYLVIVALFGVILELYRLTHWRRISEREGPGERM